MTFKTTSWFRLATVSLVCFGLLISAFGHAAKVEKKAEPPRPKTNVSAVAAADLKLLQALDKAYRDQTMSMKVIRTTKVPNLGWEKRNTGTIWISKGRLRMELDGDQKSLLIVNKKNVWAVTFPDADFKDGKLQVIRADATSKKGRSQNLLSLLSQGGFLKFFVASAVEREESGDLLFFLSPKEEQVDFKRAQIKVSADGKRLLLLNYWDNSDNEVQMVFSDFKNEKSIDGGKFEYVPPANADVMSL